MGIRLKHPASALSEKEFHRLDYQVMACAFDLYNSIGNLWNEDGYRDKLLDLCIHKGLEAIAEAPIAVTHKDFQKLYYVDLLIEGVVYELKTTSSIGPAHKSQILNYLFLTNTPHGKIINFRPESLDWQFVSTTLTAEQRMSCTLTDTNWSSSIPCYNHLPDLISELLDAWGAYLDLQLYKEAVLHFMELPPEKRQERFIPLSPETLLHFTSLSRKKPAYEKNLQKYLNASAHQQIDWINFDRNQISLHSLRKK